MLVYTAGNGVYGFTLDPSVGAYVLSHDHLVMPQSGNCYSCNEANFENFPKQYRVYIDHLRSAPEGSEYSSRYVGSLVTDFSSHAHQRWSVSLSAHGQPSQRQAAPLYEARPLAFIAEQAGGLAIDGVQPILSLTASDIHDRTPLVLGSRQEVPSPASIPPACRRLLRPMYECHA